MVKFRIDRVVKIEDENNDDFWWEKYSYNFKKPYVSKDGVMGYRLIAGLYIFYVTKEVLEMCYAEDLIEKADQPLSELGFEEIRVGYGIDGYYRISYALAHSTIDDIKKALNRIEGEPPILEIKRYSYFWWLNDIEFKEPTLDLQEVVTVNTHTLQILNIEHYRNGFFSPFHWIKSYSDFLSFLATEINREFCNSKHLIDRFAQYDGFSNEYWPQHKNKYEFIFKHK